jgi:tetratricopeptide (TPR) repeat protein
MGVTLWLVRRPFLMSRAQWAILLAIAIGVDLAAWLVAPVLVGLALALLPMVIVAVLVHWWWLARGTKPIVFISLFEGRSALGRDAANTHIGALARFLIEDETLAGIGPFAIRQVPIPLSARQAERLLRISGALAVVRGSGDAVKDTSRWEWWACFRDQLPELMITKYEFSIRMNKARRPLHQRFVAVAPATAEAHDVEGELAMTSFVATDIAVGHFQAVAKTICVLRSEQLFEQASARRPDQPVVLVLPEPTDPDVARPLQGRIAIMEARTELGQRKDHLEVLERLQDLTRSGLGNARFGVWLQAQWHAATIERWVDKPDAVKAGLEILDRFPESVAVTANAASLAIQMNDFQRGEELVDRTEGLDPDESAVPRLRANIAWTLREPAKALALYKSASKKGPPQTWQIGDCYAALGKTGRALRCYRKVLRKDSTARDALDNARALRGTRRLMPTMAPGWRSWVWDLIHTHPRIAGPVLGLWRVATPEDPWLSTWLGRHALVVGDLDIARRWIILTTRIGYANRLIATMDALVVGAIRHEGDLPRNVEHLKEHISWLEQEGESGARPYGEAALFYLASARHDIFNGEFADEIESMFSGLGFETPERFPPID